MNGDRRALKVLLAALDIDYAEIGQRMGYERGYVCNVLGGATPPSDAFKTAFGALVAELLLGCPHRDRQYPAEPLRQLVARRAADAPSKTEFYADLGLACGGWNKRRHVSAATVDRVCCALGVHPTAIYPEFSSSVGPAAATSDDRNGRAG